MREKRYHGTFNGIYDSVERREIAMSVAADELNRLAAQVETLREACEAVVVWVVVATAGGDPTRHPLSIESAKNDLRTLLTALNYPADRLKACCD